MRPIPHLTRFLAAALCTLVGAGGASALATTVPPADPPARPRVELPGLVDPVADPIPADDEVRAGVLDNGLTYYVRANDNPGAKAELRLAIRAGSVDEGTASAGLAHFLEHMLFNGTERYPENELIALLRTFGAQFGADINAYTSFDETVYELSVPARDESLTTALDVLDQWLSHATIDPAQVEAERGVVLDEWRSRTQTVDGRLFDLAAGMYLSNSAYAGRSPIGTAETIAGLSVDELRAYYDAWYRPDNAAVIVVGDIDVDDVVARITEVFGDATARTPAMPARPEVTFPLERDPDYAVLSDADQATVDVEVTLPLPAPDAAEPTAWQASLFDEMIFDILLRRLEADQRAGDAPFDRIGPGTNSFVATLDAPALYAFTDVERATATVRALLEEYERTSRFGFSDAEATLARRSVQAGYDARLEQANSTQDVEFAERYVQSFLTGAPYPAVAVEHERATAIIEGASAEALTERFRARWDNSAPHVIIAAPAGVADRLPSEVEVMALIDGLAERPLAPRAAAPEAPAELMVAPEPVAPTSEEPLREGGLGGFDPFVMSFPNGARVVATPSTIVEGAVAFYGASPGGSSLVADADAVDALFAADIVLASGLGDLGPTELEDVLADRATRVAASITPYRDELGGEASTTDLEALFQLIHLAMTAPGFDPVALTQLQRAVGPVVDNPAVNPAAAGIDALVDTRYGGEVRYTALPTPTEFATLDLAGVERVWDGRFGNAGDWVFAFAGDFDPAVLRDLAERYLGTLPGTPGAETPQDLAVAAPPGVAATTVEAGTGDTASVRMLFSTPAGVADADLEVLGALAQRVLRARLVDVIREELGESYSPGAQIELIMDPGPVVQSYVEVTGAPDRIDGVGDVVIEQLGDLVVGGPSEAEFDRAYAELAEDYQFVTNQDLLDHTTEPLLRPEVAVRSPLERAAALSGLTADDVQAFLGEFLPVDQYVRVVVVPV